MSDPVNHPSHYTLGKVECIDALEAATVNLTGIEAVCTANAIKYLWRWKQKNGQEDLKKARWYIDWLLPSEPKRDAESLTLAQLGVLKAHWREQIYKRMLDEVGLGPDDSAARDLAGILNEVLG